MLIQPISLLPCRGMVSGLGEFGGVLPLVAVYNFQALPPALPRTEETNVHVPRCRDHFST